MRALLVLCSALVLTAQGHPTRLQSGEGYVILDGDETSSFGDGDEVKVARAHGERGFWFRKDGKAYFVKDAVLLAAAKAVTAPMGKLGSEQGRLGGEQGRLGAKQGHLGAEQGRLGARMAGASTAEMEKLSAQMRDLAKQQEALAVEQEALGAKQRELGQKQEAAAAAAILKLRALREEALAKGLAQAL